MDNVIYSRTVSHPDKEISRLMAWICLTEETNGYALFEVIRLGDETQEKRLLCWHFKWDRDGAIEHAVEYIHRKQQTWDATTKISPLAAATPSTPSLPPATTFAASRMAEAFVA